MTGRMTSPLKMLLLVVMTSLVVRCSGSETEPDESQPDYVGVIADEVT